MCLAPPLGAFVWFPGSLCADVCTAILKQYCCMTWWQTDRQTDIVTKPQHILQGTCTSCSRKLEPIHYKQGYDRSVCGTRFCQSISFTHTVSSSMSNHSHPYYSPLSFVRDYLGEPEPEHQSGFYWSKRQWVEVASAGPYTNLHLASYR